MWSNERAERLKVGLLGAGTTGALRARALRRVRGVKLVAVADTRPRRAGALESRGVRLYTNGMAMINDPVVDAVVMCTPPATHEPLGLACLDAGKHLFCEHPLAISLKGCERLVRAAEGAGLCLSTGYNLRCMPAARLARELFDRGAIGDLDHIRAYHGHPGGERFNPDWKLDRSASGGGTLMENGSHVIDLARWFLGEVKETSGYATNHTWDRQGCEDNGFVLMLSEQGKVASVQSSWTQWEGYGYQVEIYGKDGYIRFGGPRMFLTIGRRTAKGLHSESYGFRGWRLGEQFGGEDWGLLRSYTAELSEWAGAIASEQTPATSGRDGLEVVRIALSPTFGFPV